jgi:hypothetical protein
MFSFVSCHKKKKIERKQIVFFNLTCTPFYEPTKRSNPVFTWRKTNFYRTNIEKKKQFRPAHHDLKIVSFRKNSGHFT